MLSRQTLIFIILVLLGHGQNVHGVLLPRTITDARGVIGTKVLNYEIRRIASEKLKHWHTLSKRYLFTIIEKGAKFFENSED